MPPPPASGDWHAFRSDDMAYLRSCGLVTLTFDLLTLELPRNGACGTDNLHPNFVVSVTFYSEVIGKYASK